MNTYRHHLPQLDGGLFLADAGLETDLIFNHGIEIPEFAAHTLLSSVNGRTALLHYFRGFLELARLKNAGFIIDCPTWKAHRHWAGDLGCSVGELREANHAAVRFAAGLRDEFPTNAQPIVLNAVIGPRGDAYAPDGTLSAREAEEYHAEQIGWLAETQVDMITAMTHTQSAEAIGIVNAARRAEVPIAVSFTVETDGRLPTGEPLAAAIDAVDATTDSAAVYYMINCAHPEHFSDVLEDAPWLRRIRGFRCNASRQSHAELDACETLDAGNPDELGEQHRVLRERMPWANVFGGCCGSDLRHVVAIVDAVRQTSVLKRSA